MRKHFTACAFCHLWDSNGGIICSQMSQVRVLVCCLTSLSLSFLFHKVRYESEIFLLQRLLKELNKLVKIVTSCDPVIKSNQPQRMTSCGILIQDKVPLPKTLSTVNNCEESEILPLVMYLFGSTIILQQHESFGSGDIFSFIRLSLRERDVNISGSKTRPCLRV